MKSRLVRVVAIAVFVASTAYSGAGWALSVTVLSSDTLSNARDTGIGSTVSDTSNATAIPTSETLTATAGSSSSTTVLDWQESLGQTIFDFDLNHQRAGSQSSFAQSYENSIDFTVDEAAAYELDGFYDLTGTDRVSYRTILRDSTTGSYLFHNYQSSQTTVNEEFVLGEEGGDYSNFLEGSLSGNLIAGHTYEFYFDASIYNPNAADTGAQAVGSVNLAVGTAIPEPTTALLLACGLVGLCVRRRLH